VKNVGLDWFQVTPADSMSIKSQRHQ